MNLRDVSIGNIEKLVSDFVDEKLPQKTIRRIASYMSAVGVNAFRLGYQAGVKEELTEEQFNKLLYGKEADREVSEMLTDITFRLRA